MSLRVVFMGTPAFAVPTLTEIVGAGHEVVAVYARPPRRSGRGMAERRSPVHETAAQFGLPVHTPASFKDDETQAAFAAHDADVAVVVAYGLLLPRAILEAPRAGCLNLHASLLPRWRGAAPVNRAILAGDRETGVSIMRMEEGLDTGPVCMEERVAITSEMTAGDLHDSLAPLGASLMVRALAALSRDTLDCHPQGKAGITYAAKLDKAETRIDFAGPAAAVHDHIRGLSPFPGAWCEIGGQRIKALRSVLAAGAGAPGTVLDDALTIACGAGAVRLVEVQPAGKRAMPAAEYLRGRSVPPGTVLR